jgi:hypothetical protein
LAPGVVQREVNCKNEKGWIFWCCSIKNWPW